MCSYYLKFGTNYQNKESNWRFLIVLLLIFKCVHGNNLFPFGIDLGDQNLPRDQDDVSSGEIRLALPMLFYGQEYTTLYVNQNGFISFGNELSRFLNVQFPLDYASIAPFYSDVDTRIVGTIFYRESDDQDLLERAKRLSSEHFSNSTAFTPRSIFIATWDNVGSFDRKSDKIIGRGDILELKKFLEKEPAKKVNTYQVILSTDGKETFAFFIYDKIEWIQGTGKNPSLPDAKAQAGFMSGSGPFFAVQGSGTDQVSTLNKRSNLGMLGIWGFRISSELIEEPDINLGQAAEASNNCVDGGSTTCHSKAECKDYSPGFCCKCGQGYFGNGKLCLQEGIPLRALGKVRGVLNGIAIEDVDLYSYIMPGEGRTYTAIARISEEIGYDFQPLSVIGTIFGWLFSVPSDGAVNGFHLTGGTFNYTAEVSFVQTGHKVSINQVYGGLDVFNQMKVETRIYGTTSVVPVRTKIELNDYEILITRVSPGVVRSHSQHSYRIEGTSVDNPFTIEQTITYEECPWETPLPPHLQTLNLKIGRNYIQYDAGEEIVRYAINTETFPPPGKDPCMDNKDKCGPSSSCVANGDDYKCICNLGYEEQYVDGDDTNPPQCVDVDECSIGNSDCDVTAQCLNTPGSYTCHCQNNYVGDGFTCEKMLTCDDVQCGANAQCLELREGEPECRCSSGFHGDGLFCLPIIVDVENPSEDINDYDIVCARCDHNAECVFNPVIQSHICNCRDGYTGDGTYCHLEHTPSMSDNETQSHSDCRDIEICDRYADCIQHSETGLYYCACRYPFVGNGYNCRDSRVDQQEVPNPTPQCQFGGICFCPEGYYFDDLRHQCFQDNPESHRTCDLDPTICDGNAVCAFQQDAYMCVCNAGFEGDGHQCTPQHLCRSHSECGQFGECIYDRSESRYKCECREGFVKMGNDCTPGSNIGCDVLNNCDANGHCIWNGREYQCECQQGFIGDGKTCQEDATGCNILNNCPANAECGFDTVSKAYRCHCKQGFDGDGYNCRSSIPCYQDRSVCSPNADCAPIEETREWKCLCKEGFIGDGYECQRIDKNDSRFLLLAKGMSVIKVPFDNGRPEPLIVEPLQTAVGIGIDCANAHIYWSDVAGKAIKTSSFNGSDKTNFLLEEIGSPEGLSVDSSSQNVYWTDSLKDTIEVANLKTKDRKTLISTDLVNPRGIVVYPQRGRLFWSDWNRNSPKIEFSGLDGLQRQILINEGLALPNSLTIDAISDQLCFADAGIHQIECVGMDGRNRRTLVSNVKYPFGLAQNSQTFYWSDWETRKIESASKMNGQFGEGVDVAVGGPGKVFGIVIVPSECPRSYSICNSYPCEEGYICLPNINGGKSCRCPDSAPSTCRDVL